MLEESLPDKIFVIKPLGDWILLNSFELAIHMMSVTDELSVPRWDVCSLSYKHESPNLLHSLAVQKKTNLSKGL